MPSFGPVSRNELVRGLRRAGFEGPFSGGKHQFMAKGNITIRVPNPHRGDIGREFLSSILRQAHISKEKWELL